MGNLGIIAQFGVGGDFISKRRVDTLVIVNLNKPMKNFFTLGIADDNRLEMLRMKEFFTTASSHKVLVTAHNGDEIFHLIKRKEETVDLAIFDYQLPITDGLLAFQNIALRQPNMKAIVISHGYNPNHEKKLLAAGCPYYVRKNLNVLLQAIPYVMNDEPIPETVFSKEKWIEETRIQKLSNKDDIFVNYGLTPIQKRVLEGICKGLTYEQIAKQLKKSVSMIKRVRDKLLQLLQFENTEQLRYWGYVNGFGD